MAVSSTKNRIASEINGSRIKGRAGRVIAAEETNGSTSSSEKKKQKVTIVAPEIVRGKLSIVGTQPLIVKQLSEKTINALVNKQGKKSPRAKEARDPHQDYLDSLYVMPGSKAGAKGAKYGFPATGIKKAVQTAAGRFLKDGTTLNGMIVAGSLFVLPSDQESNLVLIKHDKKYPKMRSDQGRNPNSGGAVVIHRGAFNEWSMDLEIVYNASVLSIDQIATLFQWAGFSVGIGEWRPEKGGTYGQFVVKT